jgi:hypothetical protein
MPERRTAVRVCDPCRFLSVTLELVLSAPVIRAGVNASVLPVDRRVQEGDLVRHPQHRHGEDKLRPHQLAQRATHRVHPKNGRGDVDIWTARPTGTTDTR